MRLSDGEVALVFFDIHHRVEVPDVSGGIMYCLDYENI
jgi:hypothetical protein